MKYFDRFDCICRVSIGSLTWIVPFFKWYTSIICNLFVWFVIVYWICIVDCLHSFKLIFDLHVGLMYVSEVLINLLGFRPIILTTMVKKRMYGQCFQITLAIKWHKRKKNPQTHHASAFQLKRKPDERQHCPCNSLLFYCNTQHTHTQKSRWMTKVILIGMGHSIFVRFVRKLFIYWWYGM